MAKRKLQIIPGGAGDENFNPWEFVDESGYSEDKFYMSSKNAHDHAEQIHLRMPPDQLAQIDALVGSDQLPYQSRQDVMRDAIVHRNHWHRQNKAITDKEWIEWCNIQEFLGQTESQQRQDEARDMMVEKARLSLQACQTRADKEGFEQVMTRVKQATATVSEPWAGLLRDVIMQFETARGERGDKGE